MRNATMPTSHRCLMTMSLIFFGGSVLADAGNAFGQRRRPPPRRVHPPHVWPPPAARDVRPASEGQEREERPPGVPEKRPPAKGWPEQRPRAEQDDPTGLAARHNQSTSRPSASPARPTGGNGTAAPSATGDARLATARRFQLAPAIVLALVLVFVIAVLIALRARRQRYA